MIRPLIPAEHDEALSQGVAILIFRMDESPACQKFDPELKEFERRRPDCPVWIVEAMEHRDLADRHHLRALPSIIIYREGLPLRRYAGCVSTEDLVEEVDELVAADMTAEINDWMMEMMEMSEAGSPAVAVKHR
jgi:thioredoxin-like negative regulator of GroEL